jgi:hypothetical protein
MVEGRAPYDSGSARRALPILSPCRAVGVNSEGLLKSESDGSGRGLGSGDEFPPPLDKPVRRRIFNLPEDARGSVELKAQQPGDTLNDRDREHNSAFLTPAVGDQLHHDRRFLLYPLSEDNAASMCIDDSGLVFP